MEKPENLYQSLHSTQKDPIKDEAAVKSVVRDLVYETTSEEKVIQNLKPVRIDPSPESLGEAKSLKKKKMRKPHEKSRRLNARERRAFKVYDIPAEAHKYDIFVQLNKLWQGYMAEVYSQGANPSQFAQKLLKADFHGAIFKVIKSKNPSYVGIEGIVVQETLSVFKIISKNNKLQQIPKISSVFTMEMECCPGVFTLYGPQLQFRAADRAVKKFKPKPSIDL